MGGKSSRDVAVEWGRTSHPGARHAGSLNYFLTAFECGPSVVVPFANPYGSGFAHLSGVLLAPA